MNKLESGNASYFGTYAVRKISATDYGIRMPTDLANVNFSIYRNDASGVLTLIPQGVKDNHE
jgi:hypothetical protein